MDRRSFLLTSLLPIVAVKQGLLGLHHPVFSRELVKDRLMIMTLKARSLGMSRLVHAQMVAHMDRMTALTIYNYGHKS
jgi:hypothetical protein